MIHPTAVVSPQAVLGVDVQVGPFCVIEAGASIGDRCRLAPRVSVKSGVTMGSDNEVGEGAVIGALAQHLSPPENPGDVRIGSGNVLRENVTIHRAMHAGKSTSIGDHCLLMVGAHVAHDCTMGSSIVLTNNVLLAGHVNVGDRAYLGGAVAVHQFCRVGRLAMIGGLARIIQDVPPFTLIDGATNLVVGLNRVGLRRAGVMIEEVNDLKAAYRIFFRSGLSFEDRIAKLSESFHEGPAAEFAPFFSEGSRGFVRERRSPPGGTIRPIQEDMDREEKRVRWAG